MTALAAMLAGAVSVGALLARPPRALTARTTVNYRGVPVPGVAGVVLVLPLAAGAAASMLTAAPRAGLVAAGAGVCFAALGLADDLAGSSEHRGLRGHLRALAQGRVTTGSVKAAGGAAAGVAAAWALGVRGAGVVVAGAVVALAANLVNLLDLRPGRAVKAWLAGAALAAAARPDAAAVAVAAALTGGAAVFLRFDLRERVMLGDAGANLLGATAGVVAVASTGTAVHVATLAVLAALTAASEVVSFGRVIDAFAPLRALDRLGRAEP